MQKKYIQYIFLFFVIIIFVLFLSKNYFSRLLIFFIQKTHTISLQYNNKQNFYKLLSQYLCLNKEYQKIIYQKNEIEKFKKIIENGYTYNRNFLTAEIIGIIENTQKRVCFINRGNKDNIKKNMIVVQGITIIGKIITVFDYYSEVLLLDNSEQNISVIFDKSKLRAIAKGNGENQENTMKVIHVYDDKINEIELGELVYSSGHGLLFPPGYLVGKVSKIYSPNSFEKEIFIESCTNLPLITSCIILLDEPLEKEILKSIEY